MALLNVFSQSLSIGNMIALPLAFAGGIVAGLNPCCLALYPAAGACCCMPSQANSETFYNAIAFVLGIAIAVAALGLIAASIGQVVLIAKPIKYAIALIPIVMGVHRLGWIQLPLSTPKLASSEKGSAFGTGLLLSLIIGPCGTPVLASVLSYAAYANNYVYSGLLLLLYGIGNGLPLVLVGTTAGGVMKHFRDNRYRDRIDVIVGGVLILLGFYLLWNI